MFKVGTYKCGYMGTYPQNLSFIFNCKISIARVPNYLFTAVDIATVLLKANPIQHECATHAKLTMTAGNFLLRRCINIFLNYFLLQAISLFLVNEMITRYCFSFNNYVLIFQYAQNNTYSYLLRIPTDQYGYGMSSHLA